MVAVNQRLSNRESIQSGEEHAGSLPVKATWRFTIRPSVWQPPIDVYETASDLIVRLEIAGMRDSIFNVRVDQNHLSISGTRPDNQDSKGFHQMEIAYGDFLGEIHLPVFVDIESIHAEYDDGFLYIALPKISPTRIPINE
jgi:HSP20 family molecular chaperone IbpA